MIYEKEDNMTINTAICALLDYAEKTELIDKLDIVRLSHVLFQFKV